MCPTLHGACGSLRAVAYMRVLITAVGARLRPFPACPRRPKGPPQSRIRPAGPQEPHGRYSHRIPRRRLRRSHLLHPASRRRSRRPPCDAVRRLLLTRRPVGVGWRDGRSNSTVPVSGAPGAEAVGGVIAVPLPRRRPLVGGLTPATNTTAPIRHRLPDFFRGLSATPVVSDPTSRAADQACWEASLSAEGWTCLDGSCRLCQVAGTDVAPFGGPSPAAGQSPGRRAAVPERRRAWAAWKALEPAARAPTRPGARTRLPRRAVGSGAGAGRPGWCPDSGGRGGASRQG